MFGILAEHLGRRGGVPATKDPCSPLHNATSPGEADTIPVEGNGEAVAFRQL
jgi:hypothetical protein